MTAGLVEASKRPTTGDDDGDDGVTPRESPINLVDRLERQLRADVGALGAESVTRPHALLVLAWRSPISPDARASERLCTIFAPDAVWDRGRDLLMPFAERLARGTSLLVLVGRPADPNLADAARRGLAAVLAADADDREVHVAAYQAFESMEVKRRSELRADGLRRYRYELGELIDIARAMTTVRDVDRLLAVILEKSRTVTGADAGSIYIVESSGEASVLRFKLTQNESVVFDSGEFTVPLNDRSIAGWAAARKMTLNLPNVYELAPGSTFQFDPSFDRRTGYVTRSMLVAPLVSQRDEVIGVIQLINKKRDPASKMPDHDRIAEQVVPFDAASEELLGILASQAGVSLETAMLYAEIRRLFEGFVGASVEAIESRDPTTSGHSRRVAGLTLALARAVDAETAGPYAGATFTADDLRELEYASLLHDFGKIGVRERVLVKARKLYDEELRLIRARFDFVDRSIEAELLARRVRMLEVGASRDLMHSLDEELARRRAALDAAWTAVCRANEPTVLSSGDFRPIEEIAAATFVDLRGETRTMLDPHEVASLQVSRGSLTPAEFDEIRSHVAHTFRFLSQIPWGRTLRRVPLIAGAHHEHVDGTGYPRRLRAEEIPVQSKMMSIADVYDALTASDRPYKKAVPVERAVDILDAAVRDGHLDGELVRIFKDAKIWTRPGGVARAR